DYPIYSGNVFCISLQTLVDSGELDSNLTDVKTGATIDLTKVVQVEITSAATINYSVVDSDACIVSDNTPIANSDRSGANAPELSENMIPIRWNGVSWVKADKRNPSGENQWYNYDEQVWANVVLVSSETRQTYKNAAVGTVIDGDDVKAYLVWIPRYKYTIFNDGENYTVNTTSEPESGEQTINIVFESGTNSTGTVTCISSGASETCSDSSYGSVTTGKSAYTHPAFTFGDEELTGFWVGKFETTGTASTPTILPNVTSLRSQNASTQFTTAQKFNTLSTYGLTVSNDAHMMKNMEWGAVAYLSQSEYGINSNIRYNNSSTYITGCVASSEATTGYSTAGYSGCENAYYTNTGVLASTTGNIYGIYDMAGGAAEYMMAVIEDSAGSDVPTSGRNVLYNSGFNGLFTCPTCDSQTATSLTTGVNFPDSKYYDLYAYGTSGIQYERGKLGDATKELGNFGKSTIETDSGSRYVSSYYHDFAQLGSYSNPWLYRGGYWGQGSDTGIFAFYMTYGHSSGASSFRTVILG
ncbi:MAG: hypothetical protein PHE54_05045, partial [Bacilli bacterium]|nr:hypothetical protein [Bacilli bacterium]